MASLRSEFLKFLKEDEEFRYAIMGLIGMDDLRNAVKTLTRNVGKLTKRINSLTNRVNSLAEAQAKTEEAVKKLALEVGRLSDTIGFGLEDIARVVIPGFLYKHEGIEVSDLGRRIIIINGEEVEVNLYGEGVSKDGKEIVVIGEVKSRIYSGDVSRFDEKSGKISKMVKGEVYRLMFGYLIHPVAEEEARRKGIKLIASYMR